MKKIILLIAVVALVSQSCSQKRTKPTDLAVKVLMAVQDNNYKKLQELLPPVESINTVFASNPGLLGITYYNKYTEDYRYEQMLAKCRTEMDDTKYISDLNKLDWSAVTYNPNVKTEQIYEGGEYTKCVIDLKFPNGDWELQYNAVFADDQWYVADGIYFVAKKY